MKMDYGYSRTSTDGQDGAGQVHRLTEAGIPRERIYLDQGVSGMKPAASRPEFARMNAVLAAGDTVTVPELSRIGRSVQDVLATIEAFESRGIALRILDLALDTSTPTGRMVVTVLAAVARLERDLISERTRGALAARKAAGVQLGRKRTITDAQIRTAQRLKAAKVSVGEIADTLQVPRSSLYRYLQDAESAVGA
jgi:putative DNA-invertase from lambdoid prophage Rac